MLTCPTPNGLESSSLQHGTPFRGAGGLNQTEMIRAAHSQYEEDQVQGEILNILSSSNESLIDLTTCFLETRGEYGKAHIACFFEQKSSNVGAILRGSWIQVSQEDLDGARAGLIEEKEIHSR